MEWEIAKSPGNWKWGVVCDFRRRIQVVKPLARRDSQCGGVAWDVFKLTQVKKLLISGENA